MAIEDIKKIPIVLQYWVIMESYDSNYHAYRRVYNFGKQRARNERAVKFTDFLQGLFGNPPPSRMRIVLRKCVNTCTCAECEQLKDFPICCDTKEAKQEYLNDKWLRDIDPG